MARFAITTTVNPYRDGALVVDLNEAGVKISPIDTSVRESRAKRHARKLIKDGKKNVMLWRVDGAHPVPIRYRESPYIPRPSSGGGNGTRIEMPLTGKERDKQIESARGLSALGRLDHARRLARA
jgi:hypothetical protein